jgi:biotin carboxyl carrier protein
MKRELVVNGKIHTVEVRKENGLVHFSLPDGSGTASIIKVEPGVYSVLLNGRSYQARAGHNENLIVVEIRGHTFEIEIQDPRAPRRNAGARAGEGQQRVLAPMPGKIIRLLVAEGTQVEPGDGIVVVEAMKMQNELKALRSGTVTSLLVGEGATVGAGELLAVIE